MKDIFSGNIDYTKSAFLNWRVSGHEDIQNLFVLAEGFLSSAIELSRNCLNDNSSKKADMLIFPILHNANHGIELYLKSLIWTLNRLNSSDQKIEGSHNIQQMFQVVQAKIKEYKGNDSLKYFKEKNENLSAYIQELFLLIATTENKDNMDFSRYPITTKYENHFYVDSLNNITIDLENFVERFEKIKESLDEISSYFFYQELNQDW
jgi:hypothetical protein